MKKKSSRSVLITGVSTGIGYGTAKAFLNRDYKVFGSVRKKEDAEKLIKEFGSNFFPVIFDVIDQVAIAHAVQFVKNELNDQGLGGLINNAGIALGGPLMYQPTEVFRSHFEINVIGLLSVTKAFLPLLGANDDHPSLPGRILNISSVGGKIASPFVGAYAGSKFAIEGISHTLRRELMFYGIEVIIIGPGAVNTPIWDKSGDIEIYKDTKYYNALKGFSKYFIEQGKKGFSIQGIGEKIFRIFETKKPKTRYALVPNKFRSWILPRLLSDRMLDRIIGKQLGFIR